MAVVSFVFSNKNFTKQPRISPRISSLHRSEKLPIFKQGFHQATENFTKNVINPSVYKEREISGFLMFSHGHLWRPVFKQEFHQVKKKKTVVASTYFGPGGGFAT
jgi:hypothetical protein